MLWQAPRKNYSFLCFPDACLLFSMCERKKWAGVPSDVFVGVRHDDMVRKGIGFGPLGGKRRGREGVGGWNTDAPQVFAITARALCLNICTHALKTSFKVNLCELGVKSQEARDIKRHKVQAETSDNGSEYVSRDKYGNNKASVFFPQQESSHAIRELWLYADPA